MSIPRRYQDVQWEHVPLDIQKRVQEIRKTRNGLYLWGDVGSGKTHIAYAIYKKLQEERVMCRFHNTTELIFELRRDFDRDAYSKSRLDERLPEYDGVLILDDIGAERLTDFVAETFYLIVNTRYNNKMPTIFTSNLKIGELADRVGDRTASRIVEMCDIVQISGSDRRLAGKKKSS